LFVRPFLDDQWSWYHETYRTISQTTKTNKKRLLRRFISAFGPETHRLMRYCTV